MWLRIDSTESPATVQVDEGVLLGRDDSCDLVLADSEVSRRHAYVAVEPDGRVTIRDLSRQRSAAPATAD